MNNLKILKSNTFSVVVTNIIIPLYAAFIAFDFVAVSDSIIAIILSMGSLVIASICYLLSIIQGLRSVANGKKKLLLSVTRLQIIMYIIDLIWTAFLLFIHRKSEFEGMKKVLVVFGVIFIILLIVVLIRKSLISDVKGEVVYNGSVKKAVTIFVFEIILPIALFLLAKFVLDMLEKHPAIGKTILIIIAILMIVVPFVILYRLIAYHDVRAFDRKFENDFYELTGKSPNAINSISDPALKELANDLIDSRRGIARIKGFLGDSKFFK